MDIYFSFLVEFWNILHSTNVFETLELISFLAKFIAGSLELGKALTMGYFKTLCSLHSRDIFWTWSDIWNGAF